MSLQYNYAGAWLLHPDRIDNTPPVRIVEAAMLGNSDALLYLGRAYLVPPPVSAVLLRKCGTCHDYWPASECDQHGLCPSCAHKRREEQIRYAAEHPTTHKYCRSCETTHPRSMFTRKTDARDGYHPYCRDCRNTERRAAYRIAKVRSWQKKRNL